MGEVTAVVVIVALVVIGLLVIVLRWRSATGEQQALRHYQNALDTLRNVSDRMESTRPTVAPRIPPEPYREPSQGQSLARNEGQVAAWNSAQPESGESSKSRASASSRKSDYLPPATGSRSGASLKSGSTRRARGFDEEPDRSAAASGVANGVANGVAPAGEPSSEVPSGAAFDEPLPTPAHHQPPVHPGRDVLVFEDHDREPDYPATPAASPTRASTKALRRSAHPPSRVPAVLAFLLVVVLIGVVAVLVSGLGGHHNASPPKSTTATTTARTHSKTTPKSVTSTTTTTLPPSVQPVASTVSIQGASYSAPDSTYTLTLSATTAPCWVYAVDESTGDVLYTGTLQGGQAQTLSASGPIDVELGHATTMAVTMNGLPVDYPTQYQAVFTMKFIPTTT